ncbi:helix-turn-helix domain-containing protein [Micromonospora sp. NPDC049801]|uniref:helix-turn-helix domain-containing protein n=1 Tax=unclassified Micromonospora TaxID=2617518 RepID=UPI0033E8D027
MTATPPPDLHVRLPVELLDLVATGKLTINAAYLYALLLTHLNYGRGDTHVWPSRSNLAKRMNLKNARAVDRYIAELIDAGLVEKECRRNEQKKVNDTNRYTLLCVSWPEKNSARGSAPQHTTPGMPEHTTLVSHSAHELEEPQLDQGELDQRSDQSGTTSSRFAPSSGGTNRDNFPDPWALPAQRQPTTGEKLTRKREDDRNRFLNLINAKRLRSDGSTFNEGVFDVDLFYDGFRKVKIGDKKIGFPGAYVESMSGDYGRGVEDWLLSLGIEPA